MAKKVGEVVKPAANYVADQEVSNVVSVEAVVSTKWEGVYWKDGLAKSVKALGLCRVAARIRKA